jgi:hypothetical protein
VVLRIIAVGVDGNLSRMEDEFNYSYRTPSSRLMHAVGVLKLFKKPSGGSWSE